MKREDIVAMPAERELDALVAEKVMGFRKNKYIEGDEIIREWITDGGTVFEEEWRPSRELIDAWEVVEKMKRNGWSINVTSWGDDEAMGEDPYLVTFGFLGGPSNFMSNNLSEAICKAALLAVMEGQAQ